MLSAPQSLSAVHATSCQRATTHNINLPRASAGSSVLFLFTLRTTGTSALAITLLISARHWLTAGMISGSNYAKQQKICET